MERYHYWEYVRSQVQGYDTVLDIGCGDGNTWKMGYQGRHDVPPPDLTIPDITGVDYDGIGDLPFRFVQADARHLPFADRSFDVVVMSQMLEHVPVEDIPAVMSEALRVARSRLVITVPLGDDVDLDTRGDEMAQHNPWIHYTDFHPDSEYPHHGHVQEFPWEWDHTGDRAGYMVWLYVSHGERPDQILYYHPFVVYQTAEGGRWLGRVIDIHTKGGGN